jgi:hypothetical protein
MSAIAILRQLTRLLGGLDYFRLADHSLSMNPVLSIKEVCRESSCPSLFHSRQREIEQFTGVQRCKLSHCLFADRCSW